MRFMLQRTFAVEKNAHKEFELTKKQFNSRTKTLAHHLIQSFVPEEVSFEEAHQVGIELCISIGTMTIGIP